MRVRTCVVALMLILLVIAPARSGATRDGDPRANGGATFSLAGGVTGNVQFNAIARPDGSADGKISLSAALEVSSQDADDEGDPSLVGTTRGVEMTAEVNRVCVENKRAVLSGTVMDASPSRLIGRRMLLVVEDNGEGRGAPADQITWGVYHRRPQRLVGDFENPDAGEYLLGVVHYVADFENPDAGEHPVGEVDVDCGSFPVSGYSLVPIDGGNIQVRP